MPYDRAEYLNRTNGYGSHGKAKCGAAYNQVNDSKLVKKELHYVETYARDYNSIADKFCNKAAHNNYGYNNGAGACYNRGAFVGPVPPPCAGPVPPPCASPVPPPYACPVAPPCAGSAPCPSPIPPSCGPYGLGPCAGPVSSYSRLRFKNYDTSCGCNKKDGHCICQKKEACSCQNQCQCKTKCSDNVCTCNKKRNHHLSDEKPCAKCPKKLNCSTNDGICRCKNCIRSYKALHSE